MQHLAGGRQAAGSGLRVTQSNLQGLHKREGRGWRTQEASHRFPAFPTERVVAGGVKAGAQLAGEGPQRKMKAGSEIAPPLAGGGKPPQRGI